MASTKPTVVLVHGAWHRRAHFKLLIAALEAASFETITPELPTSSNAIPANKSLPDDVAVVRPLIQELVKKGKEVIVVGHSYGGVVMTDSLFDLSIEKRKSKGLSGGVKEMIYLCAFIPWKDQSIAGIFGGQLPPWIKLDGNGNLTPENPDYLFYDDCQDKQYWTNMLVSQAHAAPTAPVSHESWREIPVTYLVCEKDNALPAELQRMMVDRIQKEGIDVTIEHCDAGHSPFISMPERVMEVIARAAAR